MLEATYLKGALANLIAGDPLGCQLKHLEVGESLDCFTSPPDSSAIHHGLQNDTFHIILFKNPLKINKLFRDQLYLE
jgi:hypothetical protein